MTHTYEPDTTGRCMSGWYNQSGRWIECRSTQRASVLHDDPGAAFDQMHWHGGGDCMCFEWGDVSYHQARQAFINGDIDEREEECE